MIRRVSLAITALAVAGMGAFASPASATCKVNVGSCSGNCTVNVGSCAGNCTVNVGNCTSTGTCTINVGTCTTALIQQICEALGADCILPS